MFVLAACITILSSLVVGYFNVGSFFLSGLPFVPLAIGTFILVRTRSSVGNKIVVLLLSLLAIPIGFYLFVWWNDITLKPGSWFGSALL
ncbi:hypothetical protein BH24ACI3_BH24ACI3_15920 [soil metagenome]